MVCIFRAFIAISEDELPGAIYCDVSPFHRPRSFLYGLLQTRCAQHLAFSRNDQKKKFISSYLLFNLVLYLVSLM